MSQSLWMTVGQLREFIKNVPDECVVFTYQADYNGDETSKILKEVTTNKATLLPLIIDNQYTGDGICLEFVDW